MISNILDHASNNDKKVKTKLLAKLLAKVIDQDPASGRGVKDESKVMQWNQAPLLRCTSCLVARGSEAMMAFTSVDLKDLTNSLEHSPESFHHCEFNKN